MQIGEVANLTNTTIRTVRYYLQEGLIRATDRSQGGFYLFDRRTVETVRYICHLRDLGLSLSKIKELIVNDLTEQ
jgi:DNA-binding transcriptional MerR regulator